MTSFLWATDQHLKDTNPSSRKDDWRVTCLDKIGQVKELARSLKVDAVLYGGDFFDVKTPSRTSHSLVQDVIEAHQDFPCPIYANVGNHDVKLSQLQYLDQSALGTLFEAGIFRKCFDDFELRLPGVRVVGIPFHGPVYDLDRFRRIQKLSDEKVLCMAHLLASPSGGAMFEGEDIIRYEDLQTLAPEVSVFCFGHWHKDQGIVTLPSGQIVVNIGSTSRGSLSQDNVDRIPAVSHIRLEDGVFSATKIPLRVKPAEEVFDFEKREKEEKRSSVLSSFVERVKQLSMETSKGNLDDDLKALDLPARVIEKAAFYLEQGK